jgi:hypothetical protein
MESVKTYLPIFEGFYNTIWSFNYDNLIYSINQERKEKNLEPIEFDNLNIDYKQYEIDIAKKYCEVLTDILSDYIENIEFENIYYPKTYNFSSDSVNVKITPKIANITSFIYSHKEKFSDYLKNKYTSCSGFISHYSNNFQDWETDTVGFTDFNIDGHRLGSVLEFIFSIVSNTENIYCDVKENNYEDNYLINANDCYNTPICEECKKFIEDDDILKDIKKYFDVMGFNPSKVYCKEHLLEIYS